MKQICIEDRYQIQCYKHNGKIHRAWDEAIVLDVKKDYIVVGNEKTRVTESEGTTWRTKEPAVLYFFKNKWYNIIAQMKKDGVYYYCNIATPCILEEGTIKYIDYDLDLRVFPKGEYKILDKLEYQYHRKKMEYSDDLDVVINHAMKELLDDYNSRAHMFNKTENEKYLELYYELKKGE